MGRRIVFREAREMPGFSWGKVSIDGQMFVFYFKTECTAYYQSATHNFVERMINFVKNECPEVLSVRIIAYADPNHLIDEELEFDITNKYTRNRSGKDVFTLNVNPIDGENIVLIESE